MREPHRGARATVSDEEAVEILQARAVLEGLAVRLAAERIDEEGAARLKACLQRQRELLEADDLLGASDANADLHATLLDLSGHGTAVRLIEALNSQSVRYQYRTILIPGRSAASVAEHAAIVAAVVAGRPAEAESAMRTHLFNVAQAVQQGLLPGGIDNASRGVLTGGSPRSLEDVLGAAANTVELRNAPAGPNVYPGVPPSSRTGATNNRHGSRPASLRPVVPHG